MVKGNEWWIGHVGAFRRPFLSLIKLYFHLLIHLRLVTFFHENDVILIGPRPTDMKYTVPVALKCSICFDWMICSHALLKDCFQSQVIIAIHSSSIVRSSALVPYISFHAAPFLLIFLLPYFKLLHLRPKQEVVPVMKKCSGADKVYTLINTCMTINKFRYNIHIVHTRIFHLI